MSGRSVAIPAGGRGTRIAPTIGGMPKSLAPVAGRPFVHWQLEALGALGATHAHLCLGHGAAEIVDALSGFTIPGLRVTWGEEAEPLGVIGAVHAAVPKLSDPFVVVYGDVLPSVPLDRLIDSLGDGGSMAAIAVAVTDPDVERPNVRVVDQRVTAYGAKPTATHLDIGMIAMRRSSFDRFGRSPIHEADYFPDLARAGLIAAHEAAAPCLHVGDPVSYASVCAAFPDGPS
jgi:D-glycero-alpha-D-manno-heptose 1-phosphate guanylyltransferase